MNDKFSHENAVLTGEVHHFNVAHYNEEEIKRFVHNQQTRVMGEVEALVLNNQKNGVDTNFEEIKDFIESDFLSENDIADHLEKKSNELDIDYDPFFVIDLRSDACNDVIAEAMDLVEGNENKRLVAKVWLSKDKTNPTFCINLTKKGQEEVLKFATQEELSCNTGESFEGQINAQYPYCEWNSEIYVGSEKIKKEDLYHLVAYRILTEVVFSEID